MYGKSAANIPEENGMPTVEPTRGFESIAYAYMTRDKLDSRAEQIVLIGYAPGSKGYKAMNQRTGEDSVRQNVTEQSKADKEEIVINSLEEEERYVEPLLDKEVQRSLYEPTKGREPTMKD